MKERDDLGKDNKKKKKRKKKKNKERLKPTTVTPNL